MSVLYLARTYRNAGNYQQMIYYYNIGINQNMIDAVVELSEIYESWKFDKKILLNLYEKGYELGHPDFELKYGNLLLEMDEKKGIKILEKSNNIYCINRLALYYKKKGFNKKMVKYFKKGFELDDFNSMIWLAKYYEKKNPIYMITIYKYISELFKHDKFKSDYANYLLGKYYFDNKKYLDMICCLEKVIFIDSYFLKAQYYAKIHINTIALKYLDLILNYQNIELHENFYNIINLYLSLKFDLTLAEKYNKFLNLTNRLKFENQSLKQQKINVKDMSKI